MLLKYIKTDIYLFICIYIYIYIYIYIIIIITIKYLYHRYWPLSKLYRIWSATNPPNSDNHILFNIYQMYHIFNWTVELS